MPTEKYITKIRKADEHTTKYLNMLAPDALEKCRTGCWIIKRKFGRHTYTATADGWEYETRRINPKWKEEYVWIIIYGGLGEHPCYFIKIQNKHLHKDAKIRKVCYDIVKHMTGILKKDQTEWQFMGIYDDEKDLEMSGKPVPRFEILDDFSWIKN